MPDISTIAALLSSVKTATDIAKLVKNSDLTLEGAEFKLKMAELISTLADVKMELADIQNELQERDQIIAKLEGALSKKSATTYDGKLYWMEGDGFPYCAVCIEKDGKHHHLTHTPQSQYTSEYWYCNVCKTDFHV